MQGIAAHFDVHAEVRAHVEWRFRLRGTCHSRRVHRAFVGVEQETALLNERLACLNERNVVGPSSTSSEEPPASRREDLAWVAAGNNSVGASTGRHFENAGHSLAVNFGGGQDHPPSLQQALRGAFGAPVAHPQESAARQ